MKLIIVALAFVAIAAAAPVEQKEVKLIRSEYDQKPDGAYLFEFESDDGTSRSEQGEPKEVLNEDNKPQVVVTVRGTYSYVNPDGTQETITYYADETGFHADGPSVPKAPARR